ncbi:MAG: UDP-N-acetylglucosamine 1-carboxyvinyltransferase [Oscillospiraceae bacterium]|nr:UDP-N-acetylglucosamine 1-carboxyvinyltransferase [Oscillospiraceae bacterium]
MERLTVYGGKALRGCVTVPAAKNSVLPIAAASLMLDGESVIKKCPALLDVNVSMDIINTIGCRAYTADGNLHISYADGEICKIDNSLCKKMRSSILYLAPVLYRRGKVEICLPGGCNLGKRQIDIHLAGLEKMGAEIECRDDSITVSAPDGLKGATFRLHTASVGATQTLLMAAATAKGITILRNCAREPEVADLARFLRCAGARITGAGKSEIIIQGVASLSGVEYTPIADRIFAATVLSAVNACKGMVFIKNYPAEYMRIFEKMLEKTGLNILHFAENALAVKGFRAAADINVHTGYYPSFPTDMGPLLSSALVNNNGTLVLTEGIFENRFSYAPEFEKLGLCCRTDGSRYYQTAGQNIYRAELKAADLRAGAALVVAALAKRGKFTIEGLEYIDRGYEKIEEVFSALGGDIRRDTFGQQTEVKKE